MSKQEDFIREIVPFVQSHNGGILPSLILAQACLESGYGSTQLATEGYNLFGIKGTGITLPTQEWDGTKMITIDAQFQKYDSWEGSIKDHTDLFHRLSRYANLIGETDIQRACYLVWKDGYATDPDYPTKLMELVNEYQLTAYDVSDDCPEWAKGARELLKQYGITDGERPNDPVTRSEVWTMLNRLWAAEIDRVKGAAANG